MAESLNICHVYDNDLDVNGGMPNYLRTLSEYQRTEGHSATIIAGSARSGQEHEISLGNTISLPMSGSTLDLPLPTSISTVTSLLGTYQPDVLQLGLLYSPFTGGRFAKQALESTAIVGNIYASPLSKRTKVATELVCLFGRSGLTQIDEFITPSAAMQSYAKSVYKVDSTVVPYPIDVARFRNAQKLPEYDDDKTNIFFMGRHDPRKGCDNLIAALAAMDRGDLRDTRVVVAGSGPLTAQLKQATHKHHLNDIVSFPGVIPEAKKAAFLASADVTVLPATGGESFGIVVAEAIAAGGTVLAGDNIGYRSILGQRTPDLLVDSNNVGALAGKMKKLITNRRYRQEMNEQQQAGIDEYDISTVGKATMQIYEAALQGKAS